MLVAFGRYSGKGAAAVKITGTLNGEKREFVTDVKFDRERYEERVHPAAMGDPARRAGCSMRFARTARRPN